MGRIVDWHRNSVPPFVDRKFARLVIEVDDEGIAEREIGFDERGQVIHKWPGGVGIDGKYGLCDMAKFELGGPSDLSVEEFERLWAAAADFGGTET
jgi:hypothetical protein